VKGGNIMTAKEKAQQLVTELQAMIDSRIFDDLPIERNRKDIAHIARIGALQIAIVKIKGKFGL
jgi:hypothetical protein